MFRTGGDAGAGEVGLDLSALGAAALELVLDVVDAELALGLVHHRRAPAAVFLGRLAPAQVLPWKFEFEKTNKQTKR